MMWKKTDSPHKMIYLKIILHQQMQQELMNKIYYSHLEVKICTKLAETYLFLLSMFNQGKQKISQCHLPLKYSNYKQKRTF